MKEHILFKLATRSRMQKAYNSILNIMEMCQSDNYTILLSCDFDDAAMKNFKFNDSRVVICYGTSKNKIDAINRDLDVIKDWDILINTSDDMVFTTKGFDNIIRQDFAGNLDQVLHYSDGNQKENIMTMSIMGKEYYERFNYIYYPDYMSLWCDAEATDVAVLLGKYKYMGDDKVLFRHMHPAWGLAESDEQYQKTESQEMWNHDYKVILERKARSYDLPQHLIINPPKYAKL